MLFRSAISRTLVGLVAMSLFGVAVAAVDQAAASSDIEVRTFDDEPLGEPPVGCTVNGDVVVAEAPFGDAGPDNRAVRLVDDSPTLTTTTTCDYPASDEKYLAFTFMAQRHQAWFTFGIRGDTSEGGSAIAWWFAFASIAGTDDVVAQVYDGATWSELGRVEGFGAPDELRPVTLAVAGDVAELKVGAKTFITDSRRDETVNLTDVVFSSGGRSAVGMEFYIDDLAVGSDVAGDLSGIQFVDAVSWLGPVVAGDTSPEQTLVRFRPIGGAPDEAFAATVDWGTGHGAALVVGPDDDGYFTVEAGHPYSEPATELVEVDVIGSASTSGSFDFHVTVEHRAVVAVEPEGLAPRFPSVIRLEDDRLMVAYYSGIGHVDPEGHIRVTESSDNGETWSEPRTVVSGEFDDRDPKLTQLSDGTILLHYFITNWDDPAQRRQLGAHVIRSEDGGTTWSDPIWIGTQMSCEQPPPSGGCLMSDGWSAHHAPIVELGNGDLLAPLYGLAPSTGSEDVLVKVYDGDSWHELGRVEGFGAPGQLKPVSLAVTADSAEVVVGDETFTTDLRRDETVNLTDVVLSSAGRSAVGMEFYVDDLTVGPQASPAPDLEVRSFDDEPLGQPPAGCAVTGDVVVAEAPIGDAGPDNRAVRLVDDSPTLTTTMTCDYPASDEKYMAFTFSPERYDGWLLAGVRGDTAAGGTGDAWWFGLQPASAAATQRATVVRSTDGGLTWNADDEVTIAVDSEVGFQEPNLTVLPSGEIVAGLRTGGNLYVSRSFDDGHTWSPAEPTDIPASSHDQLLLNDGSVLLTYGDITLSNRPTMGAIVPDASGDWSGLHHIPVYDSGQGDQANPSSVALEPGRFMTLGYDVNRRTLYGVFTEIEDYRDPAANLDVTAAPDITAVVGEELVDIDLANIVNGWGNPPLSLTAEINWGDGTEPGPGVIVESPDSHVVTGSHTFEVPGTFEVEITVTDRTQTQTVSLEIEVTCSEPDRREMVVIGGVDSGVPNHFAGHGCTINDLIQDVHAWDGHGQFVRHVSDVTSELVAQGVLDARERGVLTRTASLSDVGRRSAL